MKILSLMFVAAACLSFSAAAAAADTAPKSVIHVVTVAWKEGTTPAQIQAALDGVKALPAAFKGVTRVWTHSIKVQNAPGAKVEKTHAFVMEFVDEAAFKAYTDRCAEEMV
jgi:Stress responsive A/B Barrel Domain